MDNIDRADKQYIIKVLKDHAHSFYCTGYNEEQDFWEDGTDEQLYQYNIDLIARLIISVDTGDTSSV